MELKINMNIISCKWRYKKRKQTVLTIYMVNVNYCLESGFYMAEGKWAKGGFDSQQQVSYRNLLIKRKSDLGYFIGFCLFFARVYGIMCL